MEPVKTAECNIVYQGDGQDVADLHCQRIQLGAVSSFWKPSEAELAELQRGGTVRLTVLTEPIPPVRVDVYPAE